MSLSCSYNPHKANIKTYFKALGKNINLQSSKYENFIMIPDFNAESSEAAMSDFMDIYNLKNLVKHPTSFKNPGRPSCIDLIFTK